MEYGGQDDEATWKYGHGFSSHQNYFLHFVHRLGVTGNGVFSAKLMFEQMSSFALDLKRYKSINCEGMMETIDFAFEKPRYIQVLRKDRERQAISFVRAAQTGAWTWAQTRTTTANYDAVLLDRAQNFLREKEDAWNESLRNIDPLRRMTLYYEDIVDDMEATVSQLLNWLRINDPPLPFEPTSMKSQSDAVTEDWLKAWRNHKLLVNTS